MTGGNYRNQLFNDFEETTILNEKLLIRLKKQTDFIEALLKKFTKLENENVELRHSKKTLEKEILRLNSIQNIDGSNSGIPTSRTPINKPKPIPNSRKKSTKKKGGQCGHKKAKLSKFNTEAVTHTEEHTLDLCPQCQGKLQKTGNIKSKDESDFQVVIIRKRHSFPEYVCQCCHKKSQVPIPKQLKEENQYGPHLQAIALSLMNEANVSINKTKKMISGMTFNELNPSDGYLAKLQKRAASALDKFDDDLRCELLKKSLVYWDDTVISVNTKRACLRFYGTEKLAWYRAHLKKDLEGIKSDKFLTLLSQSVTVMHDHNRVNYNQVFSFKNIECNVHLIRDLRKCTENTAHNWSAKLDKLITSVNGQRNQLISRGEYEFPKMVELGFFANIDQLICEGVDENNADSDHYYFKNERSLLKRLSEYREYYFAWILNFELPFSNNLSERSLRGVKSKMKVAGQFQTTDSAKCYAKIRSYLETCYRYSVNSVMAIERLIAGDPYTIKELEILSN